jgi:hypothetical protein
LKSYLEAKYGQSFDLTNPNFPLNVAGREVSLLLLLCDLPYSSASQN